MRRASVGYRSQSGYWLHGHLVMLADSQSPVADGYLFSHVICGKEPVISRRRLRGRVPYHSAMFNHAQQSELGCLSIAVSPQMFIHIGWDHVGGRTDHALKIAFDHTPVCLHVVGAGSNCWVANVLSVIHRLVDETHGISALVRPDGAARRHNSFYHRRQHSVSQQLPQTLQPITAQQLTHAITKCSVRSRY